MVRCLRIVVAGSIVMFIIQSNIGLRAFPDEMLHHLMGIIPITERTRIADLTGDSSSHGMVGIIVS